MRQNGADKPPQRKNPRLRGFSRECLYRLNIRSLATLGADGYLKADFLVFLQRFEAINANFREVGKKVIATCVGGNEAEAFGVVKPFYGTGFHGVYP